MKDEMHFAPNSHKYKTEQNKSEKTDEKKVEKVIKGTAKVKKKSKLADIFIAEDVKNVKSYVLMDVLIPTIKDAISDIVKGGIDMILYGESRKRSNSTPASSVSYRSYYNSNNKPVERVRTANPYKYNDVIFETRGEAEEVLSKMDEMVERYQLVSVADFYDMAGLSSEFTDNKYGWTNIRNAEAVRVRDGWVIKLPKAMPIDQ